MASTLKRFQLGIVTMEAFPWELEDNFQRMESYVREAAARRAQVVIAPEAILDGYVCGVDPDATREGMLAVAETVPDGPYLQRAGGLCRELGIYLIFGFLERDGDDMFNSCVMLDPEGQVICKFSKVHTSGEAHITPGRELRTFDTELGRIGFLICKDRSVVDNFSTLGVQGAELIFLPMDGAGGPENTQTMAQRAKDNSCWIVIANTWSCAIIDPTGAVSLEKYESECISVQRVHPYKVADRSRFANRRPDLYAPLMQSSEDRASYDAEGRPTAAAQEFGERFRKEKRESKVLSPPPVLAR